MNCVTASKHHNPLLGLSLPMQKVFELIRKVSQTRCSVLITGESGTGKELVARAIHDSGPFRDKPFLPVDCGAMVPTLVESELFGHVRGAFTGAVCTKEGLLRTAQDGTVFLDEIAELSIDSQAKLLRALQEREIRPVGSTRQFAIDPRVIAATNRDLEGAIRTGRLREDLYYRLNVVRITVPPLRDRKDDIPILAQYFLDKHHPAGKAPLRISKPAMNRLMSYNWPGNVRELQNCVERAVVLASGAVIEMDDCWTTLLDAHGLALGEGQGRTIPLRDLEREAILRAIVEAGGDKVRAAGMLQIGKTTLYRRLRQYQLQSRLI